VVVKGKVLQLKFPMEIHPTKTQATRSEATGGVEEKKKKK
jgi:hypothetical protein